MAGITARLSIGQVAERTGLSVHALRFYEGDSSSLPCVAEPVGDASTARTMWTG